MSQDNATARQAGMTDEQYADMAADYGVYHDADNAIIGRFCRAILAAHSADARNGEGVALSEHQWHEAFAAKAINGAMLNVRMAVEIVMETLAAPAAPVPPDLAPCIGQCGNAVPASGDRICYECRESAPAPAAQADKE